MSERDTVPCQSTYPPGEGLRVTFQCLMLTCAIRVTPFIPPPPKKKRTSNTWGEDPFIWHSSRDNSLHMYYHCMRYGHGVPNSPGLHAWSHNVGGDGRDVWHTTKSPSHQGAYSTNVSLEVNASWTNNLFHRRERPDFLFNDNGEPVKFYSALQETSAPEPGATGFGWSFGFGQDVNQKRQSTRSQTSRAAAATTKPQPHEQQD